MATKTNDRHIPSHTILSGQKDKYVIGAPVGRGGVGTVYRALAKETGDTVAIKVLHGERFGLTDAAKARMKQEIVIATEKINSEFVVRGLDHGDFDDNDFLVMEWMGGGVFLNGNSSDLPQPAQSIRWIAQLLKGFRDIKDAGYFHRDIKTNNVLLSASGIVKLGDLGVARSQVDAANLTLPEDRIGSLLYISERQRQNPSSADSSDDFYSLCVVIYELLSGRRYHTRNPNLRALRPAGIPLEILQLVDWGIEQKVIWHEVYGELCRCINLEQEKIDATYVGSFLCPLRMIDRKLQNVAGKGKSLLGDHVADESQELMDQIVACVKKGFLDAVERIEDSGLRPNMSFDGNDCIYFSTNLSAELYAMLEKARQDETYGERGYGWLTFTMGEVGICCDCLNGKRLSIDDEYLPKDWREREITECDQVSSEWLFQLGYGLAIEAVLAALDYASELIDIGIENEDTDE